MRHAIMCTFIALACICASMIAQIESLCLKINDPSIEDGIVYVDDNDNYTVLFEVELYSCSEFVNNELIVVIEKYTNGKGQAVPWCYLEVNRIDGQRLCKCNKKDEQRLLQCQFQDTLTSGKNKYLLHNSQKSNEDITFTVKVKEKTSVPTTTAVSTSTSVITTLSTRDALKVSDCASIESTVTTISAETSTFLSNAVTAKTSSGHALTMVPFGVSMIAVNCLVISLVAALVLFRRKGSHGPRHRDADRWEAILLEENRSGDHRPRPPHGKIYEEIPDQSLAISLPCLSAKQDDAELPRLIQHPANVTNALPTAVSFSLAATSEAHTYPKEIDRRLAERVLERDLGTLVANHDQPTFCSTGRTRAAFTLPIIDHSLTVTKLQHSESDPCCTRADVNCIKNSNQADTLLKHNQSDLMKLIAKLANVADFNTGSSPSAAIPESSSASPQHTYTGLRSANPSTSDSGALDSRHTAGSVGAYGDSRQGNDMSFFQPLTQSPPKPQQQEEPFVLTLTRERQKSETDKENREHNERDIKPVYHQNPTSETFLKTTHDSLHQPQSPNFYERHKFRAGVPVLNHQTERKRSQPVDICVQDGRQTQQLSELSQLTSYCDNYLHPTITFPQENMDDSNTS